MQTMKYNVSGAGFRWSECFAIDFTVDELKRHIRAQYPGKAARIWIETGVGIATTRVAQWTLAAGRRNFRCDFDRRRRG